MARVEVNEVDPLRLRQFRNVDGGPELRAEIAALASRLTAALANWP